MYVAIRQYEVKPEDMEKIVQEVESGFVPIVSQTPGFVAYYAIDHGEGRVASVGIFEDAAGAQESDRRAADWVKSVAHLFPSGPVSSSGTVRVHASA